MLKTPNKSPYTSLKAIIKNAPSKQSPYSILTSTQLNHNLLQKKNLIRAYILQYKKEKGITDGLNVNKDTELFDKILEYTTGKDRYLKDAVYQYLDNYTGTEDYIYKITQQITGENLLHGKKYLSQNNDNHNATKKIQENALAKPYMNRNATRKMQENALETFEKKQEWFNNSKIDHSYLVFVDSGTPVIGRGFFGFGDKLKKTLFGWVLDFNNKTVTVQSCKKDSKKEGKTFAFNNVHIPDNEVTARKMMTTQCSDLSQGGTCKRKQCKQRKQRKSHKRNNRTRK